LRHQTLKNPNKLDSLPIKQVAQVAAPITRRVTGLPFNRVKGISMLLWPDKSSSSWSLSSNLGMSFDKYLDLFSCLKVSQNLELS